MSNTRSTAAQDVLQRRYRCVCGDSFECDLASGTTCPSCGRHYDPQVFAAKFADTMTFAGDLAQRTIRDDPSAVDALIGTTQGHYRLVARLGEGGMGCVYQAVDESLQRYVAVKVMRQPGSAATDLFKQLQQEARAQARVNHPNVVHIYYVGQTEHAPFFAMELINGRTLANRLEDGPLPFAEVVRVGLQVASALERAAQFDIIHGDVKPSNILEADSQTVKISDFGLSRFLSAAASVGNPIVGTPNYLSPERARGDKIDARSDIYSLGVTLFELTFGKLPYQFSGASLNERLDAHLTQLPKFPDPWSDPIPEAWRDILQKMLAKNPADRYPSYAELIADFERVKPKRLIQAPRLSRVIAWLIDAGVITFLQTMVIGAATILSAWDSPDFSAFWKLPITIGASSLVALLLVVVIWMQCRWGATPGKMLFELAIVDPHGLRPSRRKLSLRVLFQFPLLTIFFTPLLVVIGLDRIEELLFLGAFLMIVVSAGFLFFRRDQKALHDYLLGTQVVVHDGS